MQTPVLPSHGRIIRIREVIAMTGLSRSSIYAAIKQGTFPPQLKAVYSLIRLARK